MLVWTPAWRIPCMTLCSICMRTTPSQILQYWLLPHAALDPVQRLWHCTCVEEENLRLHQHNYLVSESLWCASCQPGILHWQYFSITFQFLLAQADMRINYFLRKDRGIAAGFAVVRPWVGGRMPTKQGVRGLPPIKIWQNWSKFVHSGHIWLNFNYESWC